MPYAIYQSPFGALTLTDRAGRITHLYFPSRARAENAQEPAPERFAAAIAQLEQYFNGDRRTFELPLDLRGSALQQRVWRALQQIPYGTTTTYGALAQQLTIQRAGRPTEPQAVA